MDKVTKQMLDNMRRNGSSESQIAMYARDFAVADSFAMPDDDEDPRDRIVSETFQYNMERPYPI